MAEKIDTNGVQKIQNLLKLSVSGTSGACFIAEAGFDSEFFSQAAWDNLLTFISFNPDINVVFIDGAVSRLDRPEFLTADKLLTYWNTSKEDAEKISEEIKNHEQYNTMTQTQMQILEERLSELKKKCPKVQIILSGHSDGLQFSFSAMMNELMLVKQQTISEKIQGLNISISKKKNVCRDIKKQKAATTNKTEVKRLEKKLEATGVDIEAERNRRTVLEDEQRLYRVKKVRPMHQVMTRELTEATLARYQDLCDKLGVNFIPGPALIMVNDLVVDYSHSRHYTWNVIRRRDEKLLESFHGKMAAYLQNMQKITGGKNVDVVVESHHGIGCKHTQRTHYQPDSINFTDIGRFDSTVTEQYLSFLLLPTFENHEAAAEYLQSKRTDRLGVSSKPTNTRNNPAIDRCRNNSNTGIVVLTKNGPVIGTQWISYQNILDGSVLQQPEKYHSVFVSSDEHIGHPAEDPLARRGFLSLYRKCLQKGFLFRGKETKACGYVQSGDIGEANSASWPFRPTHKLTAEEAMAKAIELSNSSKNPVEKIMNLAQFAMSGSVENMEDILDAIAESLMTFAELGIEHSDLKYIVVIVPGNHTAGVLAKHGIKDSFAFRQRLEAKKIGVFEVGRSGESDENTDPNVRIALGGYEVALIIHLNKFGLSKDNEPMFGPIKLTVMHDPKGSKKTGLVGVLKNNNGDLAIGGHTHEHWVQLVKTADNSWGVALRVATMQKVTATEMKYADSLPRTTGASIFIMPRPGDFSEFFLNTNYLRQLGWEDNKRQIEEFNAKKK